MGAAITPDNNYVMSTDGPRHHLRIRSVTRNLYFPNNLMKFHNNIKKIMMIIFALFHLHEILPLVTI